MRMIPNRAVFSIRTVCPGGLPAFSFRRGMCIPAPAGPVPGSFPAPAGVDPAVKSLRVRCSSPLSRVPGSVVSVSAYTIAISACFPVSCLIGLGRIIVLTGTKTPRSGRFLRGEGSGALIQFVCAAFAIPSDLARSSPRFRPGRAPRGNFLYQKSLKVVTASLIVTVPSMSAISSTGSGSGYSCAMHSAHIAGTQTPSSRRPW